MKKEDILIIKKTWRLLKDIDPLIFGDVFYSKLFLEYPFFKKIFKGDREDQYKELIDLMTIIVLNINNLDKLREDLIAIASKNTEYGVKPEYYKKIGETLIWTLEKGLGNDWNNETERAWRTYYTLISGKMIKIEPV
ncbi:MAG: globin domain-containing protein [Bacteroidota bacterium]